MGGNADVDPPLAESLDLGQVRGDGGLPRLLEPTPRIRDVEAREADARLLGGLGSRKGGVEAEVVELAHGGVSGGQHLAVRAEVELAHRPGRVAVCLLEHAVAPGPEVTSGGSSAKGALERMAVGVDEAGERSRSRHGRRH